MIGFTQKSAERFFDVLTKNRIQRIIDVRLNNSSQLAAFSKQDDLAFFLRQLGDIDYMHLPSLAPNAELIKAYRGKRIPWPDFERGFLKLLQERRVEETLDKDIFAGRAVLLCSELTPEKCHRRLVVEYLNAKWGDLQPVHL